MDSLGKQIKQRRTELNLTVREFATRIQKSPGYVSRIEVREEVPSAELLCTIAGVLEIEPEVLMALAKRTQLEQAEQAIDERHSTALALHRKEKK